MHLQDSTRYLLHLFFYLIGILLFGSIGYVLIEENWTFGHALYMTVITITTVGFGEVRELSMAGRYFTIVLIFVGFGIVAVFLTQFSKLLIESEIEGFFGGGKMKAKIKHLQNHYIICGYGRIGSYICDELAGKKIPFSVVEQNEELVNSATKKGYLVLRGNANNDGILRDAGIQKAVGIVAAMRNDADNLFVSLAARELNKKIFIISRSEEPGIEHRLLRAGADIIVTPLKLGGKHISDLIAGTYSQAHAESLNAKMPNLLGFSLRVFRHPAEDVITVGEAVKQSHALFASAVRHEDGKVEIQPPPEQIITSRDSLVIFVKDEDVHPNVVMDESNHFEAGKQSNP